MPIQNTHFASNGPDKEMMKVLDQLTVIELDGSPRERGQAHGGIRDLLEHLDVDLEAIHLLVALAEDPQLDGMARYYAGRALGNIGRHETAANLMLSLAQGLDVGRKDLLRHAGQWFVRMNLNVYETMWRVPLFGQRDPELPVSTGAHPPAKPRHCGGACARHLRQPGDRQTHDLMGMCQNIVPNFALLLRQSRQHLFEPE